MPELGNAWHLPESAEIAGEMGMRVPLEENFAETAVTVFSGNQFRGGRGAGDQLQTGSVVFFRKAGDLTWNSTPLTFRREQGNNKYFAATLPDDRFAAGDVVQYYFRITYRDRDTTYVRTNGTASGTTANEAEARNTPFSFEVRRPLQATGEALKFDRGPVQARLYRETGHIEIAGPDLAGSPLSNVITLAPPSVRIAGHSRSIGRVLSATAVATGLELEQELDGRRIKARLRFLDDGVVRYEVTDWAGRSPEATSIAGSATALERFFGFGEKFNTLDQSGKVVRMETFDQPGNKGDRSYKVVPWFVSTRGYGLHFDSSGESIFDMRAAQKGRYSISNPSAALAFNVVYGPRLTDVLQRFTGYVGRPSFPPPFAFGPWISSDIWRNGGEIRYAVTKWRERGIPASVFVFDSPWEEGYNDFRFNMSQFGEKGRFEGEEYDGFATLAEMMTFLQKHGLKVLCWLTPFVNRVSRTGEAKGQREKARTLDDGRNRGVFVKDQAGHPIEVNWWKGKGFHVDFTDPAARSWLQDQLRELVGSCRVTTRTGAEESVIGGFKTDDGEALTNADSPDMKDLEPARRGVYIRRDARYADGRTGDEMRNGYCVEYHRAVWEVLGDEGLIFARSGFTGTQAYSGCWAGDNQPNFGVENGLPSVIVAGLSAAMSGYAVWGHDIGGYLNHNVSNAPIDLFRRWTQFGCFTPIMQLHRQVANNPNDLRQYPWGYPSAGETADDNSALAHFRTYAQLHTALFPYLYTYAKRAHETGVPILRPLVLMHQDDPRTHAVKHTYYFGEELLVAPVIEPNATERTLYLPAGEWVDFWSHEIHAGKQDLAWTNADRGKLPILVRRGSIIPLLLDDADTLCNADYVDNPVVRSPGPGLKFLIYPAGTARFEIHDGTVIQAARQAGGLEITLTSPQRPVLLRVLESRPASVRRDGTPLAEATTRSAFDGTDSGWHFAASEQILLIKFGHTGGTTRVSF